MGVTALIAVFFVPGLGLAAWESLGPGGGGWLWSLAVAPDEQGTIFVGCDVGGVYRSSDHGRTWDMVNTGLTNHYVQAIAVDPKVPSTLYAATRGGVCQSTDRGDHWALKRTGFPAMQTWDVTAPIAAVAVDPSDTSHVLAGVGEPRLGKMKQGLRGGIYVSTDGAESWRFIESPAELTAAQVFSIVFAPAAPKTVLAATDAGIFRSEDGGETWVKSSAGFPGGYAMEIAADAHPGVFYATFADPEAKVGGVARSDDFGQSWRVVREERERNWDYWRIVADPSRPNTVYASVRAGGGIYQSADGGATWRRITRDDNVKSAWFYVGFGCTALTIDPRDPRRLYYANDMEIYGTADGGETWEQLCTDEVRAATPQEPALWRGRGIETTCSASVAVAPGYPSLIYLGYWDTGLWRTTDGGRTFAWVTQWMGYGKAAALAVDPTKPWRAWISYGANDGPHRIWRTQDYGRDWRLVGYEDTGLPAGAIFSLLVDPASPADRRILYAPVNGRGVFKSQDDGETWERVDSQDWGATAFTNIAMSPRDPRTLFLGTRFGRAADGPVQRGGVWRSTDGGCHWTRVADIPERPRIALAPSDLAILYVGERDYSSVGRGGVYRSSDGGRTWRLMAERLDEGFGNIARSYIAALAVDPRDPNVVYASSVDEGYDLSSGKGLFVSRDGGETWEAMNAGLANFNCHDLIVDPNDPDRLYAGTAGNGFFRWGPRPPYRPLPLAPEAPAPPDPLCTTPAPWTTTADKRAEITEHDEAFWWGRGYIQATMDTTGPGARLVARFPAPLDISQAGIVSLRIRGRKADATPLCISRMRMYDGQGRPLLYERDVNIGTTWTLVELPLRDWEGEGFDKGAVARYEFEFWAPYPEGRPYELAVGAIRFR